MQVNFETLKMRDDCSVERRRQKRFGNERSKKIGLRLDQMTAAETLAALITIGLGHPHQLSGDRDEVFSIDLDGPYRLLFEVDMDPVPRHEDGGIATENVDTVVVTSIENTHGKG